MLPDEFDAIKILLDAREICNTDMSKDKEMPPKVAEALIVYAIGESCCNIADGGHGISVWQADTVRKATHTMANEGDQRPVGILLLAILHLMTHHRQTSAFYLEKVGEILVEMAEKTFAYLKGREPTEVSRSADNQFLIFYWTWFMLAR